MNIIPCQPIPAQSFNVTLGGQSCNISLYQKTTGIFIDLKLNGVPLLTGVLCRQRVLLVRQVYLGFFGDISFIDTSGFDDPSYVGLGTRWQLVYLQPSELV